ncbi:MAG TPA: SMC-Scp complex subunit ScpB [Armatimonadota bacterium]|nr:SMC-Scp complex subunit ScpB [Armatimonadota bacterium]
MANGSGGNRPGFAMTEQNEQSTTPDLLGALECLLFMADHPLALGELAEYLDIPASAVRQLLERLENRYLGMKIIEVAGGYELVTKPEYAEYVSRLHEPPKLRLSPAALETLAIVAYRQPITRPEIEQLRGVNSDRVVATLQEHGLLCERGHKDAPGKPMMYGTTDKFLKHFGLADVGALPDLAMFMEQAAPPLEGFTEKE